MVQKRRTKIIATLGPATAKPDILKKTLQAGVDLVRLNFSHGNEQQQIHLVNLARECAAELGMEIGILADLQGPKLRIARFQKNKIVLHEGQSFILDAQLDSSAGDEERVGIDYKSLINDVNEEDILLLDDGRIELIVEKIQDSQIFCRVNIGGELSDHKGINRLGGGLSAEALTSKDRADIEIAAKLQVDYIALSFPRSAADVIQTRQLVLQAGSHAGIIAKIERREALDAIDEIINASDAVMVARGDLGVEIGDAEVPGVQKTIIQRARTLNKAVITATQMMESMITNSIPTRAEVSDVANAVLDGTDALMLSAETATGRYPEKVVAAMARTAISAERNRTTQISRHRVECHFNHVDEAIAMAAMYTANHFNIKAIVSLTESGTTTLWMSRIRSGIPIYGLSRHINTQRRMTLYRGVYPIHFDPTAVDRRHVNRLATEALQQQGILNKGDFIILTKGHIMGTTGGTCSMQILQV